MLDAASGKEQSRVAVDGAALASPVLANGRLITVATNGSVEGLGSTANHAPSAPILSGYGRPLDVTDVTLRWLPAVDPDAELASYEIRIDTDGEVLETWQQQLFVGPGTTTLAITAPLSVGTAYTYAVRARDGRGALSSWSAPETFSVTVNPAVTVGGTPATNLRAAVAGAQPGDVIMLGAGVYTLTDTLRVGPGVSIRGAGAGRTTLDANKLGVGISFDRGAPGQRSGLDGVTVAGANTCVQIADGTTGVSLTHVIVRDCRVEGVAVRAGGEADVVNATFAGNGTAVRAIGTARVKNSLFTDNGVAAAGDAPAALTSTYNNLFANVKDYAGAAAGTGDFSTTVSFTDFAARDFRLAGPQRSTDKGDPADDVGDEPAPNGGRINLGAFGGTADAELTAPSTGVNGSSTSGAAPTSDPHQVAPTPTPKPPSQNADDQAGGCSVAPRAEPRPVARHPRQFDLAGIAGASAPQAGGDFCVDAQVSSLTSRSDRVGRLDHDERCCKRASRPCWRRLRGRRIRARFLASATCVRSRNERRALHRAGARSDRRTAPAPRPAPELANRLPSAAVGYATPGARS